MDALNSDNLQQAVIKVLRDYQEFLGSYPNRQFND